jgi:hypothetical protein
MPELQARWRVSVFAGSGNDILQCEIYKWCAAANFLNMRK